PAGLTFGNDGNLYVASRNTDGVLRFSGATGASLGAFVAAGAGGLDDPRDVAFGPDGDFFVLSTGATKAVLRYDGATGQYLGVFVPTGATTTHVLFSLNGSLYVGDSGNTITRYDGTTGDYLGP